MRHLLSLALTACILLGSALAAGAEDSLFAHDNPSPLLGGPVNTTIAGGAILPKGKLLTAINASFRDKTRTVNGNKSANPSDTYSQTWLLKIRYGLFDRMEMSIVVPYMNNDIAHQSWRSEGLGDATVGTSLAVLSERAGDPFWLTLSLGISLPTGDEHLTGQGATGGRLALSWAKDLSKNILAAGDLIWEMPFSSGYEPYGGSGYDNFSSVERGNKYTINGHIRYRFNYFDLGLESTFEKTESSDGHLRDGGWTSMYNGTTEWVLGPSLNVAFDSINTWLGVGVFFPIYQDADTDTKLETVRWEFKVGTLW